MRTRRCKPPRTTRTRNASVCAARRATAALASAALAAVLAFGAPAHAQTEREVAEDWDLKPSGVAAGGQFRLLFVSTTGWRAGSSEIAEYNAHVQAAAAAGHADIRAFADDFTVLGSTPDVNVRLNTLTRGEDTDAPIYWLGDTGTDIAVATGHADFYDAAWQRVARTEAGALTTFEEDDGDFSPFDLDDGVYTGSLSTGVTATDEELGSAGTRVRVLYLGATGELLSSAQPKNDLRRFLGLSPVFRVATASSAKLRSLALVDAYGNGVALDPAFLAETTAYGASTGSPQVTVRARAMVAAAAVEYVDADGVAITDQDDTAEGHQIGLENGANVVGVRVTAGDGSATQTYTVTVTLEGLVSNIDNDSTTSTFGLVQAQGFTTGSNPTGYRLASAIFDAALWDDDASSSDTHLTVWSDVGGEPDARIARLTTPSLETGRLTFAARHDRLFLEPGTPYFLVVNHGLADDQYRLHYSITNDDTEQSAHGWTIANTGRWAIAADPSSWGTGTLLLRMRLNGDALPDCAVELGDRTEIWSGKLTAGAIRHVAIHVDSYGFRRVGSAGALSEDEFDFGSAVDVAIDKLSVRIIDGTLVFDESPALPAADHPALRLHVCGDVFDLADATLENSGLTTWPDAELDWSTVHTRSVALSASSEATLSALAVDGTPVTGFVPDQLDYATSVPHATERVTVQPTVSERGALVAFLDGADEPLADANGRAAGQQVDLVFGSNTVKVQVTSGDRGTTLTYIVVVTRDAPPNNPPTFDDIDPTSRDVAENTATGTDFDGPVTATDDDSGDMPVYTLEGPDAGSFAIGRTSGQLSTVTALDHETKDSYTLTVKADDERGGTDMITVTVNVTDVAEKPATPALPMVSATADTTDSVDVGWAKPALNGGPEIVGYKLRYEVAGSGSWTETTPSGTGTTATIGGLEEDTEYAVQVRALNGETPSDWSASGEGRTGATNTDPTFEDIDPTSREVAENTATDIDFGAPVTATDADGDTPTYTLEGPDAGSFGIDAETGQLRTVTALDHEAKASYEVTVKAEDGRGGTATIDVTVDVADVAEKPATADTTDSVDVGWAAPGVNGGPEIVGYRLQYEVAGSGSWTETTPSGTGVTTTIGGLEEDTGYAVQVKALNGETPSDWSAAGFGSTGAGSNGAPTFDDTTATREVAENTASGQPVGAEVEADDPDDDPLTYTLEGPDAASFDIDAGTGQLRTGAALDHESDPSYQFTVKADDERGGTDTILVTVNVADVAEPPQAPGAPTVSPESGSATSLSVRWSAPANAGPPVTEYDLRYREAGGSWTDSPTTKNIAGRTASIGELVADTEYQVQVLARSDEGESGWSAWGRGRTNADDGPAELAVLTIHALASSVPVDGVARFELRRSGGDMGWLKVGYRTDESDGNHVRSWGYFGPGRASKGADFRPTVSGTVTAHLTGPSDPLCTPDDAPSVSCTDDYEIGSPSSASMRVTAASSSAPLSARVVGDLLTLRYPDPLDAGSTPGPKDWVVRAATDVGSRTLAVTGVSVSGAEVALVLWPPAAAGESVAVSYLPWAMHPLLGPEGAEAAPLTELPVRNETPAFVPVQPPLAPLDIEADLAGEPTAGTPAPFGPWLSALLAERPAASFVRLDLPDRGLTDVSALAGLTGLEVLDLHGNALADVWPLAGLANLRRLDLSANRIEDVSALAGLAALEVLLLDGNRVDDVLPLALLPRLARLDLSGNRVADAALLAELRSLARLDLSGNRVADASPLGDLSRLVWLDLSGNPVSDAGPLGRLTALRWLWLDADDADDADTPGREALAPR